MVVRIKNLRVGTIIGVHERERRRKQDVVINVELAFDGRRAAESDRIEDTIDYQALAVRIAAEVGASRFFLLEKLADCVLRIVMEAPKVQRATVEVDKPNALRLADSVSVSASARRPSRARPR